jgi:pyridoxine/pyridoxamine 5'-phosphate oxidase
MSPQTRAEIRAFMDRCELAVVSSLSAEGTPQSAAVAIAVTAELEVVFDTVSHSRKYRNLKARGECSVTVWSGEVTVQYEGVAEEPTGADLDRFKEVYFQKLPGGPERQSWAGIAYFVVRPKWVRYSDFDARPRRIEEFTF